MVENLTCNYNPVDLFISPHGKDRWSGKIPEPDECGTDGPVATVGRAQEILRERKCRGQFVGPVTVWMRGGRYEIAGPLVFGPEDAGPITYRAYPGEEPVIDGGMRIGGWRVSQIGPLAVWETEVPGVALGQWHFRQLFVNGSRRRRARLPKEGFYRMESVPDDPFAPTSWAGPLSDIFVCVPGDIRPWRNLTDVEVVVLHYWLEERMPIDRFDPETRRVKCARMPTHPLIDDWRELPARYYVDNVFEGLQSPGDWYLDRTTGKLTYAPLPGEEPDAADVVAPRAEQLLKLAGDPDQNRFVEYLRFQGIRFEHADWHQPDYRKEWLGRQDLNMTGSEQAANNIPGVILLEGARFCAIEDCRIRHIGWYGIELGDGCVGNRIVGNELFDLGAGGVKLNGSDAGGPPAKRTGNNKITDNHIGEAGRVFHSAVGILCMHSFGNEMSHNHIHDLYYTGISVGWVWGFEENIARDNRIEKNHIHDLGHGWLSDMGGIYTLGVQPGTVIRGNLIHDIVKANYGGWAIYTDEGSAHILIEKNICYDTTSTVFHQHYGRENTVRNNIFAFGREGQVMLARADLHLGFTLERNVLISDRQPLLAGWHRHRLAQRNFISDLNVLWELSGELFSSDSGQDAPTYTVEQMRALGYDRHSVAANPRCRDAARRDFALMEDSPVWVLGFEPIDMSDVGPRPPGEREE